jgi:putative DNA primase/helicase
VTRAARPAATKPAATKISLNDLPPELVEQLKKQVAQSLVAEAETPANGYFPLTEKGNGHMFAHYHGDRVRYVHGKKQWYVWSGKHWKPDATQLVNFMAGETALKFKERADRAPTDKLRNALMRHFRSSSSAAGIEATLKSAAAQARSVIVDQSQLDSNPWLLNMANGTIDLQTGVRREHQQDDLLTKLIDLDFEPDARSDVWERFLAAKVPDAELRNYLQRLVGYTFTGFTNKDMLPFLFGEGGTGKSTFLWAIASALGAFQSDENGYASVADDELFTASDYSFVGKRDMHRHVTSRMVISEEFPPGVTFNVATVKNMVSGAVKPIRELYKNTYRVTPVWKVWLAANDRPMVRKSDSGMWRRLRVLPFDQKTAVEDETIRDRVKTDPEVRRAVLAWGVKGCLMFQKSGIGDRPVAVRRAAADYRAEGDDVEQFLERWYVADPDGFVATDEIENDWRADTLRYQLPAFAEAAIAKALTAWECERKQRRMNGKRYRGWEGIKRRAAVAA